MENETPSACFGDEKNNEKEIIDEGSLNQASPTLSEAGITLCPTESCVKNASPARADSRVEYASEESLRGDAIGDTVYTERFVLRTMLALSKSINLEGEEQLEENLCALWDMAADVDVVKFLLKQDALDTFLYCIEGTEDGRLIEILTGIIGNMCGFVEGFDALTAQPYAVELLFKLLNCADTGVLLELFRIFPRVAYFMSTNRRAVRSRWCTFITSFDNFDCKFSHILHNSMNKSVLVAGLRALDSMVMLLEHDEAFEGPMSPECRLCRQVLSQRQLIEGLMRAFLCVNGQEDDQSSETDTILSESDYDATTAVFLDALSNLLSWPETKCNTELAIPTIKCLNCVIRLIERWFNASGELEVKHLNFMKCVNGLFMSYECYFDFDFCESSILLCQHLIQARARLLSDCVNEFDADEIGARLEMLDSGSRELLEMVIGTLNLKPNYQDAMSRNTATALPELLHAACEEFSKRKLEENLHKPPR